MNSRDDEREEKNEKQGAGRPATKFMERPKPGQQDPSKSEDAAEQYWGQGRQQKEKQDRSQGKPDPAED